MDQEQKEAFQSAVDLLKLITKLIDQTEQGFLDPEKKLPDDLEDRLLEVKEQLKQLDEMDREFRESIDIDDETLEKLKVPRRRMRGKQRRLFEKVQETIWNLQKKIHDNKVLYALQRVRKTNPNFQLVEPEAEQHGELLQGKTKEKEVSREDASKRKKEARRQKIKKYRKSGGFRNWNKL